VDDQSDQTGLLALQGPRAVAIADRMTTANLADVGRFAIAHCELAGVPVMAARTGYTGEDGFELACAADRVAQLWDAILAEGQPDGVLPIGLGARDTLRLEARLCLYGSDIDDTTTPYEAGLGWVVKLDCGDFVGKAALEKQKSAGVGRKLVGFTIKGRGIARHGYPIKIDGEPVGEVTSGTTGIWVGGAIGMGYLPAQHSKPGTQLTIDCRGKDVAATVHKGPFYTRRPQ
jgi:aminomethyltransferase